MKPTIQTMNKFLAFALCRYEGIILDGFLLCLSVRNSCYRIRDFYLVIIYFVTLALREGWDKEEGLFCEPVWVYFSTNVHMISFKVNIL